MDNQFYFEEKGGRWILIWMNLFLLCFHQREAFFKSIPKVQLVFRAVYCTVPNSYYEFFKVIYGWEFLFLWILLSFLGKSKRCFKVILCWSKPLPSHSYTTDNQLKLAQMESFFNDVSFWKSTDNFSEWTHVLLNFESFWITCKVSTKSHVSSVERK